MEVNYDITIGIPVYNVENYIRRCLMSILSQTFEGRMEILIVNDSCSDGTMDIIKDLQELHPRGKDIRIIEHQENQGVGIARNTIIDHAQGKYLLFVDSDDYITTDCVKILFEEGEKHQAEVVYGSVKTVNNEVELNYLELPYKVFTQADALACYAFQNLHENLRNYIWNTLFLLDYLKEKELRFPTVRFHEDVVFSTDLIPLVSRAVFTPKITYYYVIRDHSLSNIQGRTSISQEEAKQFIEIYTYVKNKNIILKDKPYYEARCARSMTQMLYIASGLIKNRRIISPPISNKIIKDAMKHPASFNEIMNFKQYKAANLAFYVLGILPNWLTVSIITIIAKYKKLL